MNPVGDSFRATGIKVLIGENSKKIKLRKGKNMENHSSAFSA